MRKPQDIIWKMYEDTKAWRSIDWPVAPRRKVPEHLDLH